MRLFSANAISDTINSIYKKLKDDIEILSDKIDGLAGGNSGDIATKEDIDNIINDLDDLE